MTESENGCSVRYEDAIDWPVGWKNPAEIKLERILSGRIRALGFRLIADRTTFTDPHYRGGYQIVSNRKILAGRDFEFSLTDVSDWVEQEERKHKRKRA